MNSNEKTVYQPLQDGVQNVAYTGTAGSSTTFLRDTLVQLCPTTTCFVLFSDASSATVATTTTGFRLPIDAVVQFGIRAGQKISAIQETTGGTLNIVELTP